MTDFQLGARDSFRLVHWLILGALTTVQFLNILDFIVIMPLGPLFLDGMKLTTEQFGAVVASYGYASSAAASSRQVGFIAHRGAPPLCC